MKTFVLYHGHCADGFGAAYAAWCAFGEQAEYHAVNYGEPMPEIPAGARVFIVDFSYPRTVLLELWERVQELVVLDHHKTAAAELAGLSFARFDASKSGAVLAWEYFRALPDSGCCFGPVPRLLLYVQDRDLWRWELPQSREVSAGLWLHPRHFPHWMELIAEEEKAITRLGTEGQMVLEVNKAWVGSICARMHWRDLDSDEGTWHVAVVNTPVLQSEACEELLNRHPEADAAAAFFDKDPETRIWSLRSRPDTDVSVLAKARGGGGHPQAAGFEEKL